MPTPGFELGVLPPEATPTIPAGDAIVLYIHGGPGSRLEEAGDLVGPLHAAGLAKGKRFTVVAFDQPSQGYSSMIDPLDVVPPHDEIGDRYPLVQFSEEFVAAFIDALDKIVSIKHRNVYIIGGSTGGAITLRMGHRPDPWIKKIVAWSPASVWTTYAHDVAKGRALNVGFGRANESEDGDKRKDYFNDAFGKPADFHIGDLSIVSVQPNPEEWYRGNRGDYPGNTPPPGKPFAKEWPCKWEYIGAARLEHQEVYNPEFRRWHWRLGTELLLFSFFNDSWVGPANTASGDHAAIYEDIHKPTLLAASEDDDWNEGPGLHWENRWTRTRIMAPLMRNTPGYTLYLPDTGHSIHNERPILFAEQMVEFFISDGSAKGPLLVRPLFEQTKMPGESCLPQLQQIPRIPHGLLENGDAEKFLLEPARLGSRFSDGKTAGEYSLRLKQEFRDVAKKKDPTIALATAAESFYRGDAERGRFFAELAVTGRYAFDAFRKHPPSDAEIGAETQKLMGAEKPEAAKLQQAVKDAQARAYQVAWALRNPDGRDGYNFRRTLGWLAVSGEDDPPARPVNVPSGIPIFGPDHKTQVGSHPQYELAVTLPGEKGAVTFQVRYTVASP
jgi:pimeloyl-ACP methyl ester carboxylesterase